MTGRNRMAVWAWAAAMAGVITAGDAVGADIGLRLMVDGLNQPLYVTAAPGDGERLFILERATGDVRVFDRVTNMLSPTPYLHVPVHLPGTPSQSRELGLLGLAFHPDFATNGKLYASYIGQGPNGAFSVESRIAEFTVASPGAAAVDGSTERIVLRVTQPAYFHQGGWIGFGPNDGYLYIALGDGGRPVDDINAGQTTTDLLSNVLRIDVDDADPGLEYAIPADNPYAADGDGFSDEIWSYGLRNPWRSSFDRATGDLYIADVGLDSREEVNFQPASSAGGENYGWRLREGTIATPGVGGPLPGAVDPLYEYTHGSGDSQGQSVTGGYVYRGPIAELYGAYFFADFVNARIWSIRHDGVSVTEFIDWTDVLDPTGSLLTGIASFGEDNAGNLYVVDYSGAVYVIEAIGVPSPASGAMLAALAASLIVRRRRRRRRT